MTFLFLSILIQAGGFLTSTISHLYNVGSPLLYYLLGIGGMLLVVPLPWPWRVLNLLLPVILFLNASYEIPSFLITLPAVVLLFLYLPTFRSRVPYYPTPQVMYEAVATEIALLPMPFSFVDLGSGFGGMLFYLARRFPECSFTGVELGIFPFLLTWLQSLRYRNVIIKWRSFTTLPYEEFTAVYAFLAPPPMPLLEKTFKEHAPLLFLSNSFPLERPADKVLKLSQARGGTLYCYSKDTLKA